jgi:hypothetical protein
MKSQLLNEAEAYSAAKIQDAAGAACVSSRALHRHR